MMRRHALVAALGISLFLSGCGDEKTLPTEPGSAPDPTATFTRVQNEIFTPSCAFSGCHGGASPQLGLNLVAGKAYGSIVGVGSAESQLLRIAPGDPNDSYVVVKVRGDAAILGARMPLGGPYLSSAHTSLLVDWVRRGAPND
jgi:hypothetical protein